MLLRHALLLRIPLPLLPTLPVLLIQDLALDLDLKDRNLVKAHTVDLLIQPRHLPMPLLPMLLRHALLLRIPLPLLPTLPVLLIQDLDLNLDLKDRNLDKAHMKDPNLVKAHTVDLIQHRHLPMLLRHALLLHTLPLLLLTLPVLLIHLDHNLDKARTVHLILP